jgi:hypothetical protein
VTRVIKAIPERLALRAKKEIKATRGMTARRDLLARKAFREFKASKVSKVTLGLRSTLKAP